MELTENLKNEFKTSLRRLSNSIQKLIEEDYYDYFELDEIHRTYIEYCKAFKSIDDFADVPLNIEIKFPKTIFPPYSARKKIRRDFFFEKRAKQLLADLIVNLRLADFYLNSDNPSQTNDYVEELKEKISNQPKVYK